MVGNAIVPTGEDNLFTLLSETFLIPSELAALYDFVNSLDLRRYRDRGGQHEAFDALVSPSQATNCAAAAGVNRTSCRARR